MSIACGVCSSSYDLWARMNAIDDFETETLICGVSYVLNPNRETRFNSLVECAKKAGLGEQCALLWAHYGASIVSACSAECNAGTQADTNGPPPLCELTPCVACPAAWDQPFVPLSGRTLEGSGMNEGTAKQCSRFSRITHDPCVGATSGSDLEPTMAPEGSAAHRKNHWSSMIPILLMGVSLLFL